MALIGLASIAFGETKETEIPAEVASIKTEVLCQSETETLKIEPTDINYHWYTSSTGDEQNTPELTLSLNFNVQLKERILYTMLSNWIIKNKKDISCTLTHYKKEEKGNVIQTLTFSNLEMQNLSETKSTYDDFNPINTNVSLFSKKGKLKIDGVAIQ